MSNAFCAGASGIPFFRERATRFSKECVALYDDTEDEESDNSEEVREAEPNARDKSASENYFTWLELAYRVREVTGDTLGDVFEMPIMQFLNLIKFVKWRDNKERERIRRWKQNH